MISRHGNAKLNIIQVKWIRTRGSRFTLKELAQMFHVGKTTIRDIIAYRTWRIE